MKEGWKNNNTLFLVTVFQFQTAEGGKLNLSVHYIRDNLMGMQ